MSPKIDTISGEWPEVELYQLNGTRRALGVRVRG